MITGWLKRWILNFLVIILTAYIISGFEVTVLGALVGSIVLGVINAIIRPIVLVVTLPLNVVTLGLFTFVINGLMLYLTSAVVKGFDFTGFGAAVLAALVISIFSIIINLFIKD